MLPGPGRGTFKHFVSCILLTKTYGGQFRTCDPIFVLQVGFWEKDQFLCPVLWAPKLWLHILLLFYRSI